MKNELRIKWLIAQKEFLTACANAEMIMGWQQDYRTAQLELDIEIEKLLKGN